MKKATYILLILLIGGIGVQTLISCSSGGDDDREDDSGGLASLGGGYVVNAYNEAWVICDPDYCLGFIFYSDGRLEFIEKYGGEDWFLSEEIAYTTNGNSMVMNYDGLLEYYTYGVSGNTLTIRVPGEGDIILTKQSGISGGGGGGGVSKLVNTANEAWVQCVSSQCESIAFGNDSRFQTYESGNGGTSWSSSGGGTYSVSGSTMTLNYGGGRVEQSAYGVSGNSFTLGNQTYTKTGSLSLPSSGGGNVANGSNEAWVACGNGYCEGIVFNSNGRFQFIEKGSDGIWLPGEAGGGTYTVSGSSVNLNFDDGSSGSVPYSISGNTMTFSDYELTRQSGVTIGGTGGSSSSVGGSSSSAQSGGSSSSVDGSSSSVQSSSSSTQSSSSSVLSSSSEISSSSSSAPFVSCPNPNISYGSVTYEGQEYRTVDIGDQVWFAENLNYTASGECGFYQNTNYREIFGCLYSYDAAQSVCPTGWHLPSQAEWNKLLSYVKGSSKLRATCGWDNSTTYSNGTDDYGFSALPGGEASSRNCIYGCNAGISGSWWSSTRVNTGSVWDDPRAYCYNGNALIYPNIASTDHGTYYRSVRCVKDD